MQSWLLMNPWEERISFSNGFHCKAHTWESVCTEFRRDPVSVFQNLMHWSLDPPPEAKRDFYQGHQAKALTAALWSLKQYLGYYTFEFNMFREKGLLLPLWKGFLILELMSQIQSKLSFPPLANYYPSGLHLSPQTSYL